MRKETATSAGSVTMAVLAFLASQHHLIHMLVMSLGMGTAGMTFMATYPWLRRGMFAMALLMAGLALTQALRPNRPAQGRWLSGISAGVTLAVLAWSLVQSGL